MGNLTLLVLAALVAFGSYFVYDGLTKTPELPNIDLDTWWGPHNTRDKQDVTIRPFKIQFTDEMINDLRDRLMHLRPLTPPLENAGFTYGTNTDCLKDLLDSWKNKYVFEQREQFFNKFEHFKTNIQGLDMHFIHVKPNVPKNITVLPLMILHGWPGSVREFYELIPRLTTQRPGYDFVFEVIAPSLPGFGYSQAAVRPGLGALEMAVILRNLMHRIGHKNFYLQGGDWGHIIGSNMATLFPAEVLGFHTNWPVVFAMPWKNIILWILGDFWPSLVVEKEFQDRMYPLSEYISFTMEETGYFHIQATKPDTIGVGLTDSPAGLAAFILDKFSRATNRSFYLAQDGELLKKFTLDALLDNLMMYWVPGTGATAARIYAETSSLQGRANSVHIIPTPVPTWGIKFKYEISYQPDSFLRAKFTNYLHSTHVHDGGHFAALENPEIMSDDIFEAVKAFQQFHERANTKVNNAEPAQDLRKPLYETAQTIYDFTARDINGKDVKLDKYKGHVCIIVNVASECGLTDNNYQQLNELYEKYAKTKGLKILAFPSNQFNGQEPGGPKEIIAFTRELKVKFDVFDKVDVNGENAHPLWNFLKLKKGGTLGDFIKWNFSKFIIDKNGVPVERFAPNVDPLDLVSYLEKYW